MARILWTGPARGDESCVKCDRACGVGRGVGEGEPRWLTLGARVVYEPLTLHASPVFEKNPAVISAASEKIVDDALHEGEFPPCE